MGIIRVTVHGAWSLDIEGAARGVGASWSRLPAALGLLGAGRAQPGTRIVARATSAASATLREAAARAPRCTHILPFIPTPGPAPLRLAFTGQGVCLSQATCFDAVPRDQSDGHLARRPRHRSRLPRRPRRGTLRVPAPRAQASDGSSSHGGGAPGKPRHAPPVTDLANRGLSSCRVRRTLPQSASVVVARATAS